MITRYRPILDNENNLNDQKLMGTLGRQHSCQLKFRIISLLISNRQDSRKLHLWIGVIDNGTFQPLYQESDPVPPCYSQGTPES